MHEPLQLLGGLVGHIPELAGARVVRKLSSGPLSDKWLLGDGDAQWVLRKDKPLAARLNLGRRSEPEVLTALAASGWCPNALWSDLQKGILLVPFVPGRAWSEADMQQSDQLGRLATLLYRLHSSSAQVPPFGLVDRVQSYARYLGTSAAAEDVARVRHLLAEAAASGKSAVCHNDPVAGNVIDNGELQLIDFEFTAMGDPLFDLAVVIEHHCLPAAMVEVFTQAYRRAGGSCDMRLLEQWRTIYGHTTSLWNQTIISTQV